MTTKPPSPLQKVICYVDGFNLYFGLRESLFGRYRWLNVNALAERLILPSQSLIQTKYFTARINGAPAGASQALIRRKNEKRKRQATYLDALASVSKIAIFEGKYRATSVSCNKCLHTWESHEEKMTDVNIATEMLCDAFSDRFDTAMLISGDSDLVPPVRSIVSLFPQKRVIVAFPPSRHSVDLQHAASGKFTIGRNHLKKSQFPDTVTSPKGYNLSRPSSWS